MKTALRALIFAAALTAPASLYAQGCSQCTESVGQTPPKTQAAYRQAIGVLAIAGLGIFTATVLILRRFR